MKARELVKPVKLFFVNLGGYQPNLFEEQHHMFLTVSPNRAAAGKAARQTAFFKTNHFKGGKLLRTLMTRMALMWMIWYEIEDILPAAQKAQFCIRLTPVITDQTDEIQLGYLKLSKLK